MKNEKQINFRVPPVIRRLLKMLAEMEGISESQCLRNLIYKDVAKCIGDTLNRVGV